MSGAGAEVVVRDSERGPAPEAVDASGKVRVVMNEHGQVTDVEIDQRWRSRLTPDELTAALFDTYYAARVRATEEGPEPEAASDAQARGTRLRPLGPTAGHAERWRRIDEMRAEYHAGRERRAEMLAEFREPREHPGPHGYLTATMQWGAVVSIAGDPRQLEYASTEHIRQDALTLLSLANRSLAA